MSLAGAAEHEGGFGWRRTRALLSSARWVQNLGSVSSMWALGLCLGASHQPEAWGRA